jgi:hypothetical protein
VLVNRPTPPSPRRVAEAELLKSLDFELQCQVAERYTLEVAGGLIPLTVPKLCTAPAAWMATCRTCGARSYICAGHRVQQSEATTSQCMVCTTSGTCDELFDFLSLSFKVAH